MANCKKEMIENYRSRGKTMANKLHRYRHTDLSQIERFDSLIYSINNLGLIVRQKRSISEFKALSSLTKRA